MSRTKKDRPYWVQSNDPEYRKKSRIRHGCGAYLHYEYHIEHTEDTYEVPGRYEWSHEDQAMAYFPGRTKTHTYIKRVTDARYQSYRECDLHELATRGKYAFSSSKECTYTQRNHYYYGSGASKDDRQQFWTAARHERQSITKKMADEYNACGILEDNYTFTVYKKNAAFGGGYLD